MACGIPTDTSTPKESDDPAITTTKKGEERAAHKLARYILTSSKLIHCASFEKKEELVKAVNRALPYHPSICPLEKEHVLHNALLEDLRTARVSLQYALKRLKVKHSFYVKSQTTAEKDFEAISNLVQKEDAAKLPDSISLDATLRIIPAWFFKLKTKEIIVPVSPSAFVPKEHVDKITCNKEKKLLIINLQKEEPTA